MRTCWCRAEMIPYWPRPATALLAPGHRPDRRCRKARSRMHASWGRLPALLPGRYCGGPSFALVIRVIKSLEHFNEAVGHALIDHLAVHQPQLHPNLRLDVGTELNYMIFFGFLRMRGPYSLRWLVFPIHHVPRTRGLMFPRHPHSCKKQTK